MSQIAAQPNWLRLGIRRIGTVDLALNILLAYGVDDYEADLWHQDFKRKFIATVRRKAEPFPATMSKHLSSANGPVSDPSITMLKRSALSTRTALRLDQWSDPTEHPSILIQN